MSSLATLGSFPIPTLRRVRRNEVTKPVFNTSEPYPMLIACWVDYMRVDDRDLGSRGMLAG